MKFWKLFSPLPYFAHAVRMLQKNTRQAAPPYAVCCPAPPYAVCCLVPFRSKYIEHTVLVRERPSFIHLTICGQHCHGNCVVCSPCQINLSLLRQICGLFVYGLLCDATRLQRHLAKERGCYKLPSTSWTWLHYGTSVSHQHCALCYAAAPVVQKHCFVFIIWEPKILAAKRSNGWMTLSTYCHWNK